MYFVDKKDLRSKEFVCLYDTIKKHTNYIDCYCPKINERVYVLVNGLGDRPKCCICGDNNVNFINIKMGYSKTCSGSCASKYGNRNTDMKLKNHEERVREICSIKKIEGLEDFLLNLDVGFVKSKKKFIIDVIKNHETNNVITNISVYYNMSDNEKRNSTTLDMFILRYGNEQGEIKFKERKMTNPYDYKDVMVKHGVSQEEAKFKVKKLKEKLGDFHRERHKKLTFLEKRSKNHLCVDYYTNKGYSEEYARVMIKRHKNKAVLCRIDSLKKTKRLLSDDIIRKQNREKNPVCQEYWVKRGYSQEESDLNVKRYKKKLTGLKKEVWLNKNKATEKDWATLQKRKLDKRKLFVSEYGDSSIRASKESLLVFVPLMKWLICNGFLEEDCYLGVDGKKEYWLANSTKYYYSYDFCLLSQKIIIEYNGSKWHPRKNRMSEQDYSDWVLLGTDLKAEHKESIDKQKLDKAIEFGFNVLEIWDNDSVEINIIKCKNFIKENSNGVFCFQGK